MDFAYFLNRRLEFIRHFYEVSSAPFIERKKLIEREEEPFVPPYSENPEPPFIEEWLEADVALQLLGYTCISMLASAFHLYFKMWEHRVQGPTTRSFKNGWFNGYKDYFSQHFGIRFEDSPCRLDVLEEIILVRNRAQHPESIILDTIHYSESDLEKLPNPFFADEDSAILSGIHEGERSWLLPPPTRVTTEKLEAALSEVERFINWFENVEARGNGC